MAVLQSKIMKAVCCVFCGDNYTFAKYTSLAISKTCHVDVWC